MAVCTRTITGNATQTNSQKQGTERGEVGKSMKRLIVQFVKFGLVGVSSTIVNYLIYLVLAAVGVHYNIAYAAGFILSVPNAYFWSSRFVFKEDKDKEKRVWWKTLLKTYASYTLGFVLNSLLLVLWIDILNIGRCMSFVGNIVGELSRIFAFLPQSMSDREISEIVAPIINIAITMPINFTVNRLWAYKQKMNTIERFGE